MSPFLIRRYTDLLCAMRRCQFAVDDAREASRKLYAATTDADDLRKLDAVKRVMEIDEDITDAIVVYQRATGKTL